MKNINIQSKLEVAHIDDKMGEIPLRWFGHVQGSSIDAIVRKSDRLVVISTSKVGERPKITWIEIVTDDLKCT